MIVLGLMPMIALVLGAWALFSMGCWWDKGAPDFRHALLVAAPIGGAWLVLGTEVLSLFHAINRPALAAWWAVPIAAAIWLLGRRPAPERGVLKWKPWEKIDWLLLVTLMAIVAACGIAAIAAPPLNYDSLTYHLPRQVMWAQQHGVADFSNSNVRLIMMSPFAEFVGLHLLVLTSGDALHNLIQWCALILALIAASLIARQLGATRTGQLLAAIIAATVPSVFLEASNTTNDVVEAMWILIAAYWALTFLDRSKGVMPRAVLAGFAIGSAVLTKGTGALYAGPIGMVAAAALWRTEKARAILPLAAMGIVALAMNAGHFTRNYRQFGKITGPETKAEGGYELINGIKTPPAIASGVIRNLAIEAGTPWPAANAAMNDAILALHHWLGIDPQDLRLTFHALPYSGVAYNPHDEDRAGSPAHLALILLSLPAAFLIRRRIRFGRVTVLCGMAAAGLVLFCALLRWQPWNTRLLIPFFCMMAPALGAVWGARRLSRLAPMIAAGLIVSLAPTLQMNPRPLFGASSIFRVARSAQRLTLIPEDHAAFQDAARFIVRQHPRRVAFATGGNSPDYLFMRLLLDKVHPAPLFEYLLPRTKVAGSPAFAPDVIIAGPGVTSLIDPVAKRSFIQARRTQLFSILTPAP